MRSIDNSSYSLPGQNGGTFFFIEKMKVTGGG